MKTRLTLGVVAVLVGGLALPALLAQSAQTAPNRAEAGNR